MPGTIPQANWMGQGSENGNWDMGMGTGMRTCQHSSVMSLMPPLLSTTLLLSLSLWGGPTGICVAPARLPGLFPHPSESWDLISELLDFEHLGKQRLLIREKE